MSNSYLRAVNTDVKTRSLVDTNIGIRRSSVIDALKIQSNCAQTFDGEQHMTIQDVHCRQKLHCSFKENVTRGDSGATRLRQYRLTKRDDDQELNIQKSRCKRKCLIRPCIKFIDAVIQGLVVKQMKSLGDVEVDGMYEVHGVVLGRKLTYYAWLHLVVLVVSQGISIKIKSQRDLRAFADVNMAPNQSHHLSGIRPGRGWSKEICKLSDSVLGTMTSKLSFTLSATVVAYVR